MKVSGYFDRRDTFRIGWMAMLSILLPSSQGLMLISNNSQIAVTTNSAASSFTWETGSYLSSLDPHAAACGVGNWDCYVLQNVYETLLWYNGNTSDRVIPWLAKEYTISPDGKSMQFTLRDGIRFADGNPLNSTAVYFSLNRLVLEGADGGFLCCDFQQNYTQSWVGRMLAQNLVTVTGPLTFQLSVTHPDSELVYQLAITSSAIVDPQFVMSRDLALWTQNSTALLPYPTLSGSMTDQITKYLKDEAVACKTAATSGCNASYLDTSKDGSLAGTGPYAIGSVSADLTHTVLLARSDYWGGPLQFTGGAKIVPHFSTVYVNEVPLESDRLQDLRGAAAKGIAMSVDVNNDQLYSLANRTVWLGSKQKLVSIVQNVSLYGPFHIPLFQADFVLFVMNVSDASTGRFYQFQPFADRRVRLAFADAVDISTINRDYNDNLGQVAPNAIVRGTAPPGAYNSSDLPSYSFDLKKAQALLIDAMEHPLTSFRFFNGTVAPPGTFDNTFGCPSLNVMNKCDSPVVQYITLAYRSNETRFGLPTINGQVIRSMAAAINNISDTYHMGLHVDLVPLPHDKMLHQGFGGNLYMWEVNTIDVTPWVGEAIGGFGPSQGFCNIDLPSCNNASPDGVNSTRANLLYEEFLSASSHYNESGVVSVSNQIMELENRNVFNVWTVYPYFLVALTSNVRGFYFNPSINGIYFASLSATTGSETLPFAGGLLTNIPLLAVTVVAVAAIALAGTFVMRRRTVGQLTVGERKLAAIMFTDIVGYTALTQKNERLALELLAEHNRTLRPLFPRFGGREVKSIGDSFLVEFSSALEAVKCAVAIQEHLHDRNLGVEPERSVQLRIGVHVGDIITRGGDILGDAVNISSRIEPLAPPGGVCISEQVYDQVRNKIELQLVKLENAPLKNVSVPVDVYSIVMPWNEIQT